MGQSAPGGCPAERVDRGCLSDAEYTALLSALAVEDDASARVSLMEFLCRFGPDLRPLVQPLFASLSGGRAGDTSAPLPALVAGLSRLASRGAEWRDLLACWAPGPTADGTGDCAAGGIDPELCVELAVSLCALCAMQAGPRGGGSADAVVSAVVASLQVTSDGPSPATLESESQRLEDSVPCLPMAVAPALLGALAGRSFPPTPAVPESRVLDAAGCLLLRGMDAAVANSGTWTPLYRDWKDGRSFNGLLKGALHYGGPAIVVLKTTDGHVLGGLSASWADACGRFSGGPECSLFSLAPKAAVYRGSRRGGNYFYLNGNRRSGKPLGLGFGGQEGFFRLWLDADLEDCSALDADATYGRGPLLPTGPGSAGSGCMRTAIAVARLEVWGYGGEDALSAQADQRSRDDDLRDQARRVDRARMCENEFDREMLLGGTFKGTAESREIVERPDADENG